MYIDKNEYSALVKNHSSKSPKLKDFIVAFCVGGLICAFGELLCQCYISFGANEKTASTLVSCSLIFIAALLTGLKLFQKIAKRAGAGVLIPITGFSNAVVSPAIEFKNEGIVLGIGAKIFTIAGSVIMFGTVSSVVYGLIYYFFR